MNAQRTETGHDALRELARLYGIQPSYEDVNHNQVSASDESLIAVLKAFGAAIDKPGELLDALRERKQSLWRKRVEPVAVAWNGASATVPIRVPASESGSVSCTLDFETGGARTWAVPLDDLPAEASNVEGVAYFSKRITVSGPLPFGYHRLTLDMPGGSAETLIISAPLRAYSPTGRGWERSWGVFLPLYAMQSRTSWGAGDFGDLERLMEWCHALGGKLVGTLPLMPAFFNEPSEVSPYSPVSRLFWNELYLDLTAIPEVATSPEATSLMGSASCTTEREALRAASLVDYSRLASLKRQVVEVAARTFFGGSSERRTEFDRFVNKHPHAESYAAFRAVGERLRTSWSQWPEPLRSGSIPTGEYEAQSRQYHLFVQWLADEQLRSIADRYRPQGGGLYLDLPLGVHADGYDTWRERDAFAIGVAGGAPPDPGFPKGQNWGFVPLHPQGIREQHYRYVRAFVQHQLRFAAALRIDHMPNFHRVYWIPPGHDARSGAYVRYPAVELYAIFSLESHRHRAILVGEDLGTVPPEVPIAMARHNIHRMSVSQYELIIDSDSAFLDPPAVSLACINTHDMPPFASFWNGRDISERRLLELLDDAGVEREQASREQIRAQIVSFLRAEGRLGDEIDGRSVLRALLSRLRDGPARMLIVNLEDLWGETEPQNVPSTVDENPNWRRKARYSFEEFSQDERIVATLREIARGFDRPGC